MPEFSVYESVLAPLIDQMYDLEYEFLPTLVRTLIVLLGVAATIWTSAIAWRKFKETTNKV